MSGQSNVLTEAGEDVVCDGVGGVGADDDVGSAAYAVESVGNGDTHVGVGKHVKVVEVVAEDNDAVGTGARPEAVDGCTL